MKPIPATAVLLGEAVQLDIELSGSCESTRVSLRFPAGWALITNEKGTTLFLAEPKKKRAARGSIHTSAEAARLAKLWSSKDELGAVKFEFPEIDKWKRAGVPIAIVYRSAKWGPKALYKHTFKTSSRVVAHAAPDIKKAKVIKLAAPRRIVTARGLVD